MLENKVFIFVIVAVVWSSWLIIKVLGSRNTKGFKVSAILILLVPFIGPVMYMFAFEQPPLNRYRHRARNQGSTSSYSDYFENDAKFKKEQIKKLQKRIKDNESSRP